MAVVCLNIDAIFFLTKYIYRNIYIATIEKVAKNNQQIVVKVYDKHDSMDTFFVSETQLFLPYIEFDTQHNEVRSRVLSLQLKVGSHDNKTLKVCPCNSGSGFRCLATDFECFYNPCSREKYKPCVTRTELTQDTGLCENKAVSLVMAYLESSPTPLAHTSKFTI